MSKRDWRSFSRGKVELCCQGSNHSISSFLNQAVQTHLHFENIYWIANDQLAFTILVTDFRRTVSLLRKNGLRMKITKKMGLPFLFAHLQMKKFFYLGMLLFVALLILFSSFVWRVDIKGTEQLADERVRMLLKQEGIYVGQWKYRIKDLGEIQQRLIAQMPELSWIGLQIEGIRVLITVVEKKQVEKTKDPFSSDGPVHLVAKKDAMITDMQVEKGNPLVGVHDIVKKGDILVSGIYGELENESSGHIIGAKGKVLGEVWYEADVEVPVSQTRNVLTGESEKVNQLYLYSWIVQWPFFQPKFQDYELVERVYPIHLGNWTLPFGRIEKEYFQTKKVKDKLSKSEAIFVGKKRAEEELKRKLGKDGKILVEKVLHQRFENGKVYLKIHFDVVENIATPKPILQGE